MYLKKLIFSKTPRTIFILLLISQFVLLSSLHAQTPPGNQSTIAFSTEATHRDIQLELERVNLLDELPNGTKPIGDYFIVLFGTLKNLEEGNNCAYKSDFRLINNGVLYTLSRKHRNASKVYAFDYPSAARGQCMLENEESDTVLLFDLGESSLQTGSTSSNQSAQVDSAVLLFGSEVMVIPTLSDLVRAATAGTEAGDSGDELSTENAERSQPEVEISIPAEETEVAPTDTPTLASTSQPTNTSQLTNTEKLTNISISDIESALKKPALTNLDSAVSSTVEQGIVRLVLDGTQIEVDVNGETTSICYLGIKAPTEGEPYFTESYAANLELVLGQSVYIYHDNANTSEAECLPRYVYLADGKFVNEAMVKLGWAITTEEMQGVIYGRNLMEAEEAAKELGFGIWAADSSAEITSSVTSTVTAVAQPTIEPTAVATVTDPAPLSPTTTPTPTVESTATPTAEPTMPSTATPTPTVEPTATSTVEPTKPPTATPTPTAPPTIQPTSMPPTVQPTLVQPTPAATSVPVETDALIGPSITPIRPTPVSTMQIEL